MIVEMAVRNFLRCLQLHAHGVAANQYTTVEREMINVRYIVNMRLFLRKCV